MSSTNTGVKKYNNAVLTKADFCSLEIPKKKILLSPWLTEQSITLIYAYRGTGKTWLGLSLADALTKGGSFGPWTVENTASCLYLEAESPAVDLQERLRTLQDSPEPEEPLYIYADSFAHGLGFPRATLLNRKWREQFGEYLREMKVKVLFLDNLASLTPGIDENVKKDWDQINQFLLNLRFAGISTVMMHHTSKAGDQRGSSAREDNIDVSIKLTAPPDHNPADGARFILQFTKCRNAKGSGLNPVEFHLQQDELGRTVWAWGSAKKRTRQLVIALLGESQMQQKDIAESVGVTKGTVSKIKTAAIKDGYLTKKGKITPSGMEYTEGVLEGFWD